MAVANRAMSKGKLTMRHLNTSNDMLTPPADSQLGKWLDTCLDEAISLRASDLHLDPKPSGHYGVRLRIDGRLSHQADCPIELAHRLPARLKILANLNIAEHRRPQEGQFTHLTPSGASYACRLSCCPNIDGEMLTVRLLAGEQAIRSLSELGMLPDQLDLFQSALQRPQGLILIAGPTGSGKSETLYASLKLLAAQNHKILSIEDPVERAIDGVDQVNVQPRLGLGFDQALKIFLRMDPDVMMIGEIRELETLKMAIRAAQTGHLVLASIHANSALGTLDRLTLLGMRLSECAEPLSLIVAQRLLPRRCLHCHGHDTMTCPHCIDGELGRIGCFECLPITPQLRNALREHSSLVDIATAIDHERWPNLHTAASAHVDQQLILPTAINRYLGQADASLPAWLH